MRTTKKAPGRWEMQRVQEVVGEYYTVSRVVNGRREHFEYASDGKPMWYGGRARAQRAVDDANGRPA